MNLLQTTLLLPVQGGKYAQPNAYKIMGAGAMSFLLFASPGLSPSRTCRSAMVGLVTPSSKA